MAKGIVAAVTALAEEKAVELGLDIVDVEFVTENGTRFLRVYIYKKDGVGIDDCVALHRELEPAVDENVEISGSYTMEVSSPGYERAFKKAEDYLRYIGEKVQVKLYKPFNGSKKWTGELLSYEDGKFSVATEDGVIDFTVDEAAKVNRIFEF